MNERKKRNYWTKDLCILEALKYNSISEWKLNSASSYQRARRNKWLNMCVNHMPILGSKHKRLVYVYVFPDNAIYVGLTGNAELRHQHHLYHKKKRLKSSVYKHFQKINKHPIYFKVSDYIDVDKARQLECDTLATYQNGNYHILNKVKTGSLGGNLLRWTKNECINDAKKYSSRNEWNIKSGGAYRSAKNNGWFDVCCSHMKLTSKPKGYWTLDKCLEESLKYQRKIDWVKNSKTSYVIALKNNWIPQCSKHMQTINKM